MGLSRKVSEKKRRTNFSLKNDTSSAPSPEKFPRPTQSHQLWPNPHPIPTGCNPHPHHIPMKFILIPIKSAVLYINADNLTVYRRY